MGKENLRLTEGSKYRVLSRGQGKKFLVSVGEFRGYLTLGNDQAISMLLESSDENNPDGIRIIPIRNVLAIDVIEGKKSDKEELEEIAVYFV